MVEMRSNRKALQEPNSEKCLILRIFFNDLIADFYQNHYRNAQYVSKSLHS